MLLVFVILLIILIMIFSCNIKLVISANNHGHRMYFSVYIFKYLCIYKVDFYKLIAKYKNGRRPSLKLIIKIIRSLNIKAEILKARIKFGLNEPCLTALLNGVIQSIVYSFISIFNVKINVDDDKFHINIIPVFDNKKVLILNFKCIINIKLVHIINTIYKCKKDWRCKDYGRKSSNRRAYGNSHG